MAVNAQLETHCYPIPTPERLMQKLSGGYGFTKIDLEDAYNQIPLGPESQKRLTLSTHQGVCFKFVFHLELGLIQGTLSKSWIS